MTDEIRLSWEKKISVREIAQFYEERIRELDGKFQLLAEQSKALSENLEAKIEDLNQKTKIALEFLSKYDDVKNMIESERRISFDSLRSMFEMLQKRAQSSYREQMDRLISAQREGDVGGYIRARLEADTLALEFYHFLFDYYPERFEENHNFFKFAKAHPEAFLGQVMQYFAKDADVKTELVLPVIKGMMDDYLGMFSTILGSYRSRRGSDGM